MAQIDQNTTSVAYTLLHFTFPLISQMLLSKAIYELGKHQTIHRKNACSSNTHLNTSTSIVTLQARTSTGINSESKEKYQ